VDVSAPTEIRAVSTNIEDGPVQSKTSLLDTAADLGRKGAAFAALGEIPVDFFPLEFTLSVADKKDGVKLGESTLKDFFILSSLAPIGRQVGQAPTCPSAALH